MGPVAMAIATGSYSIPLTAVVSALLITWYRRMRAKVRVGFNLSIKVGEVRIQVTNESHASSQESSLSERERNQIADSITESPNLARRASPPRGPKRGGDRPTPSGSRELSSNGSNDTDSCETGRKARTSCTLTGS